MSAAAAFLSSCATVDAPGIVTTTGIAGISQASAICDGVAEARRFGAAKLPPGP